MDGEATRQKLIAHLEEAACPQGFDIVDVELKGGAKAPLVCVYLDHSDPAAPPITLDEIAQANSWIAQGVEELALFSGSYTLEVSSPGLERPLRRERDYLRFMGEKARVRIRGYEGRKKYSGVIAGLEEGVLCLDVEGEEVLLPLSHIAKATLVPNYNDL